MTATIFTRRRARWATAFAVAGMLALAACGDDDGDGPFAGGGNNGGDSTEEAIAEQIAASLQADSDGLITDDEADCIAQGALDFAEGDIFELEDLDFEDLPPDRQGAFLEMLTGCMPMEKLVQLGGL